MSAPTLCTVCRTPGLFLLVFPYVSGHSVSMFGHYLLVLDTFQRICLFFSISLCVYGHFILLIIIYWSPGGSCCWTADRQYMSALLWGFDVFSGRTSWTTAALCLAIMCLSWSLSNVYGQISSFFWSFFFLSDYFASMFKHQLYLFSKFKMFAYIFYLYLIIYILHLYLVIFYVFVAIVFLFRPFLNN